LRPMRSSTLGSALTLTTLIIAAPRSVRASDAPGTDALRHMSQSIEALVTRVSPSVVQVLVTGYGPVDDAARGDSAVVIGRQRTRAPGVITDADGFIITNAHVVSGAQHVRVVLPAVHASEPVLRSLVSERGRTVDARIVGVAPEVDLALLKVA